MRQNEGPAGGTRLPRRVWAGAAGLLIATLLAWGLALAFPSRTDVQVVITPEGATARVNGAKMNLEIPPELIRVPGEFGWYVAAPSESLTYEPADPAAPLTALGQANEALQWARPRAYWEPQAAPASAGGAPPPAAWRVLYGDPAGLGAIAAQAPGSHSIVGAHLYAQLVGGRVPAGLMIRLDAAGDGYAFLLRPERRGIGWWRVVAGVPVEVLDSDTYRPSFWATLADLVQEAALALTATLALLLLAGLLAVAWGAGARRFARSAPAAPAPPGSPPPPRRPRVLFPPSLAPFVIPCLVALAGLGAALAAGLGPLQGIPHVQDDVAYLWQAKIFALGRAWVPAPPLKDFFDQGFILITDGRWFTKYPPGWPLLLVPGVWAGVPWLINPLAAGVSLGLIFAVGRRLFGTAAGAWAALLGLTSPFLLFMSGSFMSHPGTMLALTGALYCFVRLKTDAPAPRRSGALWALLTGLGLGWAFISREATAAGVAIPFVVWGLLDVAGALIAAARGSGAGARWRIAAGRIAPYVLITLGAGLPLIVLAQVNQELLGSPFRLAQELVGSYDQLGFGPGFGPEEGGHTPALGLYNALVYLHNLDTVLFGWPPVLTVAPLLLALAGALGRPWREARWTGFLLGGFLGLAGVYFAWWSATTIFGPRYWYEALPFLLLLSGRGVALLGAGAAAVVRAARGSAGAARIARVAVPGVLVALLVVFDLAQVLPGQVRTYTGYNDVDASALQRVAAAHLDHALVFVALQRDFPRRDYGKVFFANDPLLQGPIVYARDLGADRNRTLLPQFPGRRPYYLPLTGPPHAGFAP